MDQSLIDFFKVFYFKTNCYYICTKLQDHFDIEITAEYEIDTFIQFGSYRMIVNEKFINKDTSFSHIIQYLWCYYIYINNENKTNLTSYLYRNLCDIECNWISFIGEYYKGITLDLLILQNKLPFFKTSYNSKRPVKETAEIFNSLKVVFTLSEYHRIEKHLIEFLYKYNLDDWTITNDASYKKYGTIYIPTFHMHTYYTFARNDTGLNKIDIAPNMLEKSKKYYSFIEIMAVYTKYSDKEILQNHLYWIKLVANDFIKRGLPITILQKFRIGRLLWPVFNTGLVKVIYILAEFINTTNPGRLFKKVYVKPISYRSVIQILQEYITDKDLVENLARMYIGYQTNYEVHKRLDRKDIEILPTIFPELSSCLKFDYISFHALEFGWNYRAAENVYQEYSQKQSLTIEFRIALFYKFYIKSISKDLVQNIIYLIKNTDLDALYGIFKHEKVDNVIFALTLYNGKGGLQDKVSELFAKYCCYPEFIATINPKAAIIQLKSKEKSKQYVQLILKHIPVSALYDLPKLKHEKARLFKTGLSAQQKTLFDYMCGKPAKDKDKKLYYVLNTAHELKSHWEI